MIRFTWRQFRGQATVAGIGLAVVAIVLAITGSHLAHLYDTTVATCATHGDCDAATGNLLGADKFLQTALNVLVLVLPGLLGVFWGAPLIAGELEAGTFRLAWAQSVTRTRWITCKLGLVGLASMVVSGLFSLMVTWWFSPIDLVQANRLSSSIVFGARDIVPIGYAAFAFVLGASAGAIIRRTLPARATTLVSFVVARIVFTTLIRPRLIAPLHRGFALDPNATGFGSSGSPLSGAGHAALQPNPPDIPNGWIYSTDIIDKAGRPLTSQVLKSDCPLLGTSGPPAGGTHSRSEVPNGVQHVLHDCVVKVGTTYHGVATYQPGSRYWYFQWSETAIFLGAAIVLAGLCFWWVRRRVT
jgi:hypothetical protein